MAREQSVLLDAGDIFPAIEVPTVGGQLLRMPADLAAKWGCAYFARYALQARTDCLSWGLGQGLAFGRLKTAQAAPAAMAETINAPAISNG